MCKNGRPKGADTSSLRLVCYGGAPTTKEQNIHFKSCFPNAAVHNCIGITEASGLVITFNPSNPRDLELMEKNPDSVGRTIPGYLYKVMYNTSFFILLLLQFRL